MKFTILTQMVLLGSLGLSVGLVGCNYNDLKNPASTPAKAGSPEGGTPEAVVDFATVKNAVFTPACIKCHGPEIAKHGLRLDQYDSAFAHLAEIKSQVESGDMPPPPPRGAVLSLEQRALLFAWIDSGGPEKTIATPPPSEPTPNEPVPDEPAPQEPPPVAPPPPVPPVTPPTLTPARTPDFAEVSQAVFQPHCIKCHSNTVQKGKVNLEVYTEAAKHAIDIAEALDVDDMPRKAPPLSPKLKAIVYAWIDGGAPETVPATVPEQVTATEPANNGDVE